MKVTLDFTLRILKIRLTHIILHSPSKSQICGERLMRGQVYFPNWATYNFLLIFFLWFGDFRSQKPILSLPKANENTKQIIVKLESNPWTTLDMTVNIHTTFITIPWIVVKVVWITYLLVCKDFLTKCSNNWKFQEIK